MRRGSLESAQKSFSKTVTRPDQIDGVSSKRNETKRNGTCHAMSKVASLSSMQCINAVRIRDRPPATPQDLAPPCVRCEE